MKKSWKIPMHKATIFDLPESLDYDVIIAIVIHSSTYNIWNFKLFLLEFSIMDDKNW